MAFSLGEGTIGLATPSREVAEYIERFLPHYSSALSESEPDEVFRIWEDAGSWFVGLEDSENVDALASFPDALNAIEQLTVSRLLAVTPSTIQIHAAGALTENGAVVALGASGAGKTSLAIHWSAMGQPILGDDVVLIGPQDVVVAFKRLIIAPVDRLAASGVQPEPSLRWLSDSEEAWFDPQSAGGWAEAAPMTTLALVQFKPGRATTVSAMPKPAALSALLASLHPTGLNSRDAFDTCMRIVSSATTVRAEFSDSAEAAAVLAGAK